MRRKPYAVILLDEIEKAHPDAFNILLQVLDEGRLTDNKGRTANFKNCIIIMTSNLGSDMIQERFAKMTEENEFEIIETTKEDLFTMLKNFVRPEFLNRIDEVVMFRPLDRRDMRKIVAIQFLIIQAQLADMGVTIGATKKVLNTLADIGYDPQLGARPLKRVMQKRILNELSRELLAGKIQRDSTIQIELDEFDRIIFTNVIV